MTGPGFFESGGAFDKGSNLIIGIVSVLAAFFMLIEYLSSKSDYEQYCTGLTGLFVEAFSGGQCSDLELYMYLTGAGSVFCGLCGFIFIIIGLQSSPKNQPQVILVPQYAVQHRRGPRFPTLPHRAGMGGVDLTRRSWPILDSQYSRRNQIRQICRARK